jgi:hypothetical protein
MHLDHSISLRICKDVREMSEKGSCLAQSAHKYVKECKSVSQEPANKYL